VRLASNLTRVLHRAGDPEGSVRVGAAAADKAGQLGAPGYEPWVITLLMVAPDCCKLGRFDEAEHYFETIIRQAKAHSDLHHLAAAYVNRSMLWFSVGRVDRVAKDLESAIGIAREIGDPFVETNALNNLAQVLYWSGGLHVAVEAGDPVRLDDGLQATAEYARRARELALQLWGEQAAAVMGSELLMARIAYYRGDAEEAARLVHSLRGRLSSIAGDGQGVGWGPADDLMLEGLELATSDGDDARWAAHAARAAGMELQHEDRLELLECRAVAAERRGRREHAKALYAEAVKLARESQNLLSARVLRDHARRAAAEA
jgi:tetratricopeptide (TPR) repeat protein